MVQALVFNEIMEKVGSCKCIPSWPNWELVLTRRHLSSPSFLSSPSPFPSLMCPTQISIQKCMENQGGFWLDQERECAFSLLCSERMFLWWSILFLMFVFSIAVQEILDLCVCQWLTIKTLVTMLKRDLARLSQLQWWSLNFFQKTS